MLSIILLVALALAIQYVEGYQKIVYVSELTGSDNIFTSGESEGSTFPDNDSLNCCVYGNCSCNSLDHALAHLTNNTVINITTGMILSSSIKKLNLQNISIIGHNNPTVNCKIAKGIHFTFCHNCIIQGITWNGCGSENITASGLKLSYSSNITIQNCSFQHSMGEAIVLSEVSGVINIIYCQFTHNSHYRGHGAAIHYSSYNVTNSSQILLKIENCNFVYNKGAKSLVYIENRNSKQNNAVTFYHSKFCHNQGTSVYVVNQKLSLRGKLMFQNNTAKNGTGIYISDYSTLTIDYNSNVIFFQNSADYMGGAVFLRNHSVILFQNSKIQFNNNHVSIGTIYSEDRSNVIFAANCEVTFSGNSATQCGTAIGSFDNSHVTFTGNSKVEFNNNIVQKHDGHHMYNSLPHGGTIYTQNYGHVSFDGNSSTVFRKNTADVGGAIYLLNNCHLSFEGNSSTTFSDNTARGGGALFSTNNVHVSFEDNSCTKFINNTASNGGAIASYKNSHICFEDNSSTLFSKNNAKNSGGAITSRPNGHICFEDHAVTVFNSNTAIDGGAINSAKKSQIYFKDNSCSLFSNNNADDSGGAIRSRPSSQICFEGNSYTNFSNNIAEYGGAVNSRGHSHMFFKENSSTVFNDNTVGYNGGAINSIQYSYISFEDNSSIQFGYNMAKRGGAVYSSLYSHLSFEVNSFTLFGNNTADYSGGAIMSRQNGSVSFKGNSFTKFSNNIANNGGAVLVELHSNINFFNNSKVTFTKNKATFDTSVYANDNSKIIVREKSIIVFNDLSLKWCKNTCLPYTGDQSDVAAIDSKGVVWCNNQEAFMCLNKNCYCKNLENLLDGTKNNTAVNITDEIMTLSIIAM